VRTNGVIPQELEKEAKNMMKVQYVDRLCNQVYLSHKSDVISEQ
jgi:hypothetical protein